MARVARAPDGRVWKVRRLWLPRLRKGPDPPSFGGLDVGLAGAADTITGLVIIVVALALAAVVFILLPYIFFLLELLIVPALLLYRVAFRRPWTVEARSSEERLRWRVVGWQRSGEVVEEIASSLAAGESRPHPRGAELVSVSRVQE